MADAKHATCPRCDAPVPADDPAGPCPRCHLSDSQGGKTEIPPVSTSSPRRATPKPILASAIAAIGAIFVGGLWFGNRLGKLSDAVAHYNRGVALADHGKGDEAIAEIRKARDNADAVRSSPGSSSVHWPTPTVRLAQATTGGASHP